MQSIILEETGRAREDLDIKTQGKRRRKIETFEREGVPRTRKHN